MTDKEKIRAFVEGRRKENWEKRYNNSGGDLFWDRANEDDEILSFIDSLQEEPVSENLEEATKEWSENEDNVRGCDYIGFVRVEEAFKAGAQWQKQQMTKDAVDAKVTARWPLHSSPLYNSYEMYVPYAQHLSEGEKVKLIVIKEE